MDLVWGIPTPEITGRWTCTSDGCGKKLEPDPANPVYIMTKWGVGYYF